MKRLARSPEKFDLFDLVAELAARESLSLRDSDGLDELFRKLRKSANESIADDRLVFGRRTEDLFERVAASLATVKLIRREDVGDFYTAEDVSPPDYRLVLGDRTQMLVEVKNFEQGSQAFKEQSLPAKNFDRVRAYADLMGVPLFVATFWVRWCKWTLVPSTAFTRVSNRMTLAMGDAMMCDEMRVLGDRVIGTRWPLRIRMRMRKNLDGTFSPLSTEHFSADKPIIKEDEVRIANTIAVLGDWPGDITSFDHESDAVVVTLDFMPKEEEAYDSLEKGVTFIGALSSMISRAHQMGTSSDGVVMRTRDRFEPGSFRDFIPDGYRGEGLPLWIFEMHPARGEQPGGANLDRSHAPSTT